MLGILNKLFRHAESSIPPHIRGSLYRYTLLANRTYYVITLLSPFLLLSLFFLKPGEEDQPVRILTFLVAIQIYPLLFKLGLYKFSRFYAALIVPLNSFYLLTFRGTFHIEYYVKNPFLGILSLIVATYLLSPKNDKAYYWIAVTLPFPFTGFSPWIGEAFSPGSYPHELDGSFTFLTTIPIVCYLTVLAITTLTSLAREKALEDLEKTNQQLLTTLNQVELTQKQLQKELVNSDDKIQYFLDLNSHGLRLPITNLKGIFLLLKHGRKNGIVKIPDDYYNHLKKTIELLDEKTLKVNQELESQ